MNFVGHMIRVKQNSTFPIEITSEKFPFPPSPVTTRTLSITKYQDSVSLLLSNVTLHYTSYIILVKK